jgi:hypothetical protein
MIKKILFTILFILISSLAYAQVFPITVTVVWDAPVETDQVTNHTLTFNGSSITVLPAKCNTTECSQQITIPQAGTYSVAVTATNMWGTSTPTVLTFNARSPGNSGQLRIRISQ